MLLNVLVLSAIVLLKVGASDNMSEVNKCLSYDKIRIDTDAVQYRPNSAEDALIPVHIHLPQDMMSCAQYLIVRSEMGSQWKLRSHYNSVDAEPVNARREPLSLTPSGQAWWIPISQNARQVTLYLKAYGAANLAPGDYRGVLEYAITDDIIGDERLKFRVWQIGFSVQRSVNISFGNFSDFRRQPNRSYYQLALGELKTGKGHSIETYFTGNTRFTLKIRSENKGRLAHRELDYHIKYELLSNKGVIELRLPSSLILGVDGSMRTIYFPLELRTPHVSQFSPAGDYYDIIYFEVTPND